MKSEHKSSDMDNALKKTWQKVVGRREEKERRGEEEEEIR